MKPSYFDVHTHVNLKNFIGKEDEVIKEALNAGVWMVNVGTDIETSRKAVALSEGYGKGVYATVGFHPIYIGKEKFEYETFFDTASSPEVVAVGECGLDYFHIRDPHLIKEQKEVFVSQIEIANRLKKPLMLHIRSGPAGNAYADSLELIKLYARVPGNSHFFSGTIDEAKEFLSLGFSLSFTGVVTFASDYDELVRLPPLEMVMAETDAPYVSPLSVRGKENRPVYVREVADRIADIRFEPNEDVIGALFENGCRLFNVCTGHRS